MSRIDKLSISGIRSFSPNHKEAIQFNTPLTLIVGYNGSGKTTIIECLKYATTGEMPPNSKGGAFIHDPKLAGEKEVLAQVKLSFRSANGVPHVVTRSLQLTVQKTKRTMKTLESSLVMTANGERSQVSLRNVKLDELVPRTLGVSAAILDAVIFCHQDESLWPLSEPAALKKRFDEIFQAAKWTKAIDALKTLRKRQGEELAKLRIEEEQDKVNRDKADRCERRSRQLQDEIDQARAQCGEMKAEMDEAQDRARDRHEQANSFLRIVQDLENKREQLRYRDGLAAEIRDALEEELLTEDDADDGKLETMLAQYEERTARCGEELASSEASHQELQRALADSRRDLSVKLAEQGRLQSDQDKHERQVKHRAEMIREAARRYEIRGFDHDHYSGDGDGDGHVNGDNEPDGSSGAGVPDEAEIRAFDDRIRKLLADRNRELERLQAENAAELDKAAGLITTLESRKAARTQDRMLARQRAGAIDKRIAALQAEMARISDGDVDEGAKALLDQQHDDVTDRLRREQAEFGAVEWDRQIREENDGLGRLEGQNDGLTRDLVESTRLAAERAQLHFRRKELSDKKRRLDTVMGAWRDRLVAALGGRDDWDAETVEPRYQSAVADRGRTVTEARRRREQARASRQKVEFRLKTARENLKAKSDEAAACGDAVVATLRSVQDGGGGGNDADAIAHVDDYPDELSAVEKEAEEYRNDLSLFDALREYYAKCKTYLDSRSRCSLCDRAFEDGHATDRSARARLERKIEKQLDPKKKDEVQRDLDEATGRLDKLTEVRTRFETYRRLTTRETPRLKDECRAAEAELEVSERDLDRIEADCAAEEEAQRSLEAIGKTVLSIAQSRRDIREAEGQVERIESQDRQKQQSDCSTEGALPSRTADEIHELQTKLADQIRAAKGRLAKLTADRQRAKDQLAGLELEGSELKNRISTATRQLERRRDFETQIRTLRDDQTNQREVAIAAEGELEGVEAETAEARSLRDEAVTRCRAREKAAAEAKHAVSETVAELGRVESDIRDYLDRRGGGAGLAASRAAIRALEAAMTDTEAEMADLAARATRLRQDLDSGDRKRRNIQDNLSYRRNVGLLAVLRQEIGDLEARRAQDDYDRLQREAGTHDNQYNRLLAERGALMGTMKTKDDELGRLLQEWEQDYQHAARRYRSSHVKVEATRAAIEDLGQYSSALDKAIMRYHSLKMEEINRIAGELWQGTYQGTDIDTILIRSDAEAGAAAGAAAGNTGTGTGRRTSYNYRLCMVKQDTEMDMRGRCSAGQKVLASIIVRLALAESFGLNCGLVALDEPTTNLDSDNIKSLAESLHSIIRARAGQANLQLIVITHDEEFLRHMRCSDFCDGFFRVKRDDRQNSVIEKESISRVL